MKTLSCLFLAAALASTVLAGPLVREIPSPAPADSSEPSLVTGPDGTTYLTYTGPGLAAGERALWLALLAPGTETWSAPRPIISTPRLMENWADFASLIVGTDGQLWAQWFQTREDENAHGYDGWFARSRDGGATWTQPAPLGHEFVSLAPLSSGRALAVWLESTPPLNPSHPPVDHDAKPAKSSHAESMRLRARLLAADGAQIEDWIVDPDTCTCCQTTLARLGGDRVFLAYRGHTPGEIRDNRYTVFNQTTWSPSRSLHDDGWKIPACPVNGPAADARGERVAVAWFTAADGVARVQAKLSLDGGITFGPALPLDLGRPIGRLDLVMLADGSALVSWLEAKADNSTAGLYVRRVFPDGTLSAPQLVAALSAARASGFARLARRDGADLPVLISWTDAAPANPAAPKAPVAMRVHTAAIATAQLASHRTAATPERAAPRVAVVRGNSLAFLEICAPDTSTHTP